MQTDTIPDAQKEYNNALCNRCGNPRFIHVQAIMCDEQEPTNAQVVERIELLAERVERIAQFIDMLEDAVKSHPMAKGMLGL